MKYTVGLTVTVGFLTALCAACRFDHLAQRSQRESTQNDPTDRVSIASRKEIEKASSIAVFKHDGTTRRYLGKLDRNSASCKELLASVSSAEPTQTIPGDTRADYEFVILGPGTYVSVNYHQKLGVARLTHNKVVQTVKLQVDVERVIRDARPLAGKVGRFRPARVGQAQWAPLPLNLVELVRQSELVFVGIPFDVVRNDYLVPDYPPLQAIIFAVVVEEYLKDDSGLNLAVIKHHQRGGYLGGGFARHGNPMMEIGQRNLFFLMPTPGEFAQTPIGTARDVYWDEYVAVHPFSRTPIVDGWTEPAEPDPKFLRNYLFADSLFDSGKQSTLVYKREQRVLAEIRDAVKRSRRR